MRTLNRKKFLTLFNKIKRSKQVRTSQVAERAGLSQSYTYKLVSPKNKNTTLVDTTAKKLCKGLNLSSEKTNHLISESEKNTNNSSNRFNIPDYVKGLMTKNGLSTNQVATKSGLNDHRLKDFINHQSQFSKVSLVKLARGLSISPRILLSPNAKQEAHLSDRKPAPQSIHSNEVNADTDSHKQKTAPTAKSTADTAKQLEHGKPLYRKLTLRPDVMELAQYINDNLNASDVAVLRLLAGKMKR